MAAKPMRVCYQTLANRPVVPYSDGHVETLDRSLAWPRVEGQPLEAFSIAVSPLDDTLAVTAANSNIVFLYDGAALHLPTPLRLPAQDGTFAVDFSRDGRWLAVSDGFEHIFVIHVQTRTVSAVIPGGERTFALTFGADNRTLMSACSNQGGGCVRFDLITEDGFVEDTSSVRSTVRSPKSEFVDTLVSMAVSSNGRWLALFETSAIYREFHSVGWCGNLVLYNAQTKMLQWQAPIDERVTGRPDAMQAFPMGFYTDVRFTPSNELACGTPTGDLAIFDSGGSLRRKVHIFDESALVSFIIDSDRHLIIGVNQDCDVTTRAFT